MTDQIENVVVVDATPVEPTSVDSVSTVETSAPHKPRIRRPKITKDGADTKPRQPRIKRTGNDLVDFKTWLDSLELGINPTIHVNGVDYTACVLTVDFGTPLKGIKLTQEQSLELSTRMRSLTKTVINRVDAKVGISTDHFNGIWWTNVV